MQKNFKTTLRLELKDKPGQLLAAIEPISKSGANIISISHQRDEKTATGNLIVDIAVSISEQALPKLIDALKTNDVIVTRVGTERLTSIKTFILIGHILHTDLTDTVERIDRADISEITELHIIMPGVALPSTAKFTIKAVNDEEMQKTIEHLEQIAEEKNLLIVDELGGGLTL